jgi:hypothetical protein
VAGRLSACHLHEPQRQLSAITALVLFQKTFQIGRRVGHLEIGAPPDFMGGIL